MSKAYEELIHQISTTMAESLVKTIMKVVNEAVLDERDAFVTIVKAELCTPGSEDVLKAILVQVEARLVDDV